MKIALCISGHMRTYIHTHDLLRKLLLDKYDIDIFIHTWSTLGFWIDGIEGFDRATADVDAGHIKLMYRPKGIVIEKFEEGGFQEKFQQHINTIREKKEIRYDITEYHPRPISALSMWHKGHGCNQLKCEEESKGGFKYDVVIKTRADVIYNTRVDWSKYFDIIINGGKDFIYSNKTHWKDYWGDGVLIGTSEAMDTICELYNTIDEVYFKMDQTVMCSHELFTVYIQQFTNLRSVPDVNMVSYYLNTPYGQYKKKKYYNYKKEVELSTKLLLNLT